MDKVQREVVAELTAAVEAAEARAAQALARAKTAEAEVTRLRDVIWQASRAAR